MEQPPQLTFLDVPTLLESSEPRPRVPWFFYAAGLLLVMALSAAFGPSSAGARQVIEVFSGLLMLAMIGLLTVVSVTAVRTLRAQQQAVDDAAELVQLRRWPQAAFALQHILSYPARTYPLRSQALVYLSMVLARYHRFEDATAIHEHLLKEDMVDQPTAVGLRMSRAMAMLQQDHLFDADRAISELRRTAGASGSAGLALIEMYRDVKTGHPEDALRTFEQKLPNLREQLGHRVADAHALAARAYDLQNRQAEAAEAWRRATLLAPAIELQRRYIELEKLAGRYQNAPAPAELA
jgi:tetratricopeptide (TPR) repeat protein